MSGKIGRIITQETREKIRLALTGRQGWAKGIPLTEEHRKKMSLAITGKKYPPHQIKEVIHKNCQLCGINFRLKNLNQEFCSLKCRFRFRDKKRKYFARKTIAEMIVKAQRLLPKGIRIQVFSAYRSMEEQKKLYKKVFRRIKRRFPHWDEKRIIREINKFVFPPDSKVPPYHSTGAALDVMLCNSTGKALRMWSKKIDRWSQAPLSCKDLPENIIHKRLLLCEAMKKAGFSNYYYEWWHWSYGDSGWALRTGKKKAIYGEAKLN